MQRTRVDTLVRPLERPVLPAWPHPMGWGRAAQTWPTLRAGRIPPEDDEYEYSEYSVEDYQDPETAWDGAGENGGWAQWDSGRGRQSWSLLTFC